MNNSKANIDKTNSETGWLPRHELFCFFTTTSILSWLFWLPSFLIATEARLSLPVEFLLKVGNFMPSIAAIIFTAVSLGRVKLTSFLKQSLIFKFNFKWYVYTLFLMPVIVATAYLLSYLTVGLQFNTLLLPFIIPKVWPLLLLLVYFIIVQGPLGEEFGWRGYALPRLLKLFNPISSSLILGSIWSVWHFPKFFLEGTVQHSILESYGVALALGGYTLYTILLTIMMTLLFIKTNGSIFSVLLFHAMANFSHGLITILNYTAGGTSILLVMLIVTSFLLFRYRTELFCTHRDFEF